MYNTPEIAANGSSGGFSNYFGVPPFQSSAVPAYLAKLGDQNSGLFKCVRYLDLNLTDSYLVIVTLAARRAGVSLMSPRNSTTSRLSRMDTSLKFGAARRQCVFPSSLESSNHQVPN